MHLIANISMLFTELPLARRIAAARDAGFDGVEIQFPYAENADELRRAAIEANMPIELINLPAGDWHAGDRGLAALPHRQTEFDRSVERCAEWARALGVRKVNVLAGLRDKKTPDGDMFAALLNNLATVAERFSAFDIEVQLEVINPFDVPGFFVDSLETGLDVISRVNHPNLGLQLDLYHMARTENSLVEAISRAGPAISHVQFADHPGRRRPGGGSIDFAAAIKALKACGYDGAMAAEYVPAANGGDGFGWMADFRRLMAD